MVEVACEDIDWLQNVEPNAEDLAYRDNVIEHCLPNLGNCTSRQSEDLGAKKVLNCNWKTKEALVIVASRTKMAHTAVKRWPKYEIR